MMQIYRLKSINKCTALLNGFVWKGNHRKLHSQSGYFYSCLDCIVFIFLITLMDLDQYIHLPLDPIVLQLYI